MNKLFITFESVNKTYGKGEASQKAADHVSFTIGEGEFVVILGPSGAGKSTVLNILGGMDRPDSGTVTVAASRIDQMTEKQLSVYRAEKVGFIFQFYNLLPSLTARENVALTKSIVGHAMDPAEALQAVGLSEHADKFPSQLSGGEQQRVSIARAIAKRPAILLGDEPTGALDSETGVKVLSLLHDICKEQKTTTILVTHNADIAQCADRVIRMRSGRVVSVECNEHPVPVEEVSW